MTTELETKYEPTAIDRIEAAVQAKAGEPVRAEEIQEREPDILIGTINASLQHLRNRRETTGIVRVSPGVFAWRPDALEDDMGDGAPRKSRDTSNKALVAEVIREAGKQVGMTYIQGEVDNRGYPMQPKQINQAVAAAMRADPGIQRVSPGVFRYNGSAATVENSRISDLIPDSAFEADGFKVVARAQDGARICVDENGVAWRVTVRVENRLL